MTSYDEATRAAAAMICGDIEAFRKQVQRETLEAVIANLEGALVEKARNPTWLHTPGVDEGQPAREAGHYGEVRGVRQAIIRVQRIAAQESAT